jgi:hypothetical protein
MTLTTRPTHKAKFWAPVVECLVMVGVGALLNLAVYPEDPGFVNVQPHPTLFVVLIIGLRYGLRASLMAVILTALTYGALLLSLADVPTYLYLLNPPYSTPAVVLVPLGVVVGLLTQKHINQVAEVQASSAQLYHENQSLRGEHEQLRDVNLELAGRVVGAEGTVEQLYEFAKQLNVADEQKIFEGLLHLLAQSLGAEKSTVWRLRDSRLEFLACSQQVSPDSLQPPDAARYDHLFDNRGVLALNDLPEKERGPHLPFLLGKLTRGQNGDLVAFVAVDTLPFERYNEESIRLFRMITEWASTSLGNVVTGRAASIAPMEIAPMQTAHGAPMSTMGGFGGEPSIELSLQRLTAMRQAAEQTPTDTSPVQKGFMHQADRPKFIEAPTTLDDMSWGASDPGATGIQQPKEVPRPSPSARKGFIPSVSVMLLHEAGARNTGDMATMAVAPRPKDLLESATGEDAPDDGPKRPGGKRGGK